VEDHDLAVLGGAQVDLDGVHAHRDRVAERGKRVLREAGGEPAVVDQRNV